VIDRQEEVRLWKYDPSVHPPVAVIVAIGRLPKEPARCDGYVPAGDQALHNGGEIGGDVGRHVAYCQVPEPDRNGVRIVWVVDLGNELTLHLIVELVLGLFASSTLDLELVVSSSGHFYIVASVDGVVLQSRSSDDLGGVCLSTC